MEFLQAVKERQSTTDAMFEPLQDIIELLRNYGVAIPEESVVQLQELPEKWANTKRLSVIAIQQVAPLQVTIILVFKQLCGNRKIKCELRLLIFCDVIAYDIAKLLYHLEFVSIQMKKFPETCNSWSLKLTQRQKLSVFWSRGQFGG